MSIVAEMIREKIRAVVSDADVADALCPKDYPFGTKRPCLDSSYFETFNLPNVRLVDLRRTPIAAVTEAGIDTAEESFEFDAIVFATGFDAMTGPLVAVAITGTDGVTLEDKWRHGPVTYLGLMTTGFPNFFTITGPQSPSVLSNMVVSIEQHVDWIADCLQRLRAENLDRIEPTRAGRGGWVQHNQDCADITLYPRRTPGTWEPTSRGSRGSSCRTSAAWTPTAGPATRWPSRALWGSGSTGRPGHGATTE